LRQPNYINLEYVFYHFFDWLRVFFEVLVYYASYLDSIVFKIISTVISLMIFVAIAVILKNLFVLDKEKIIILEEILKSDDTVSGAKTYWDTIKEKMNSANSSDWKVAIIEADSLLDGIMQKIGYFGKDLGERLKNIEPSDFDNLQNIWDAHKIRNRIAHNPGVILEKKEVDIAMKNYEKALKELKYF